MDDQTGIPPIFEDFYEQLEETHAEEAIEETALKQRLIKKHFARCKRGRWFAFKVVRLDHAHLYRLIPLTGRSITRLKLNNIVHGDETDFYFYNRVTVDWLIFRLIITLNIYPQSWLEVETLPTDWIE
ncbi:MAG: hypothetical protein KAJ07_04720 [Planctomycetes bacterium]|nr:hypothetical protein [Planctomycetota bacterium]